MPLYAIAPACLVKGIQKMDSHIVLLVELPTEFSIFGSGSIANV
jgi:hypothetical protein